MTGILTLTIALILGSTTLARADRSTPTRSEMATIPISNPLNPIENGRYWIGHTDQGLEVDGTRYRYDTELGAKPWQPISDLNAVKNGVIFDGKNYWCLSTLHPKNKIASCTADGWKTQAQQSAGDATPDRPSALKPEALEALLKKGMVYEDFREIVIQNGWAPLITDCKAGVGGEALICDRLPEVNACSGDGYCLMLFEDKVRGTQLSVTTYGPESRVKHWSFEPDSTPLR